MSAKLLVDGIGNWAFTFQLTPGKVVRIGRTKDNDLSLPEGRVSTKHAEMVEERGEWVIRDLQSHNGVFLNGTKVTQATVKDGDILKIGNCDLVFQNPAAPRRKTHETVSMVESHSDALKAFMNQHDAAPVPHLLNEGAGGLADSAPIMGGGGFSQQDNLWIATRMVEAMGELTKNKDAEKQEMFRAVVKSLKSAIQADNGFVMIVDKKLKRWVIRAWVGDYMQWNSYEQEHPLPLTIAKKAFSDKQVLSNASTGPMPASASFVALKVAGFIAVPLVEGAESKGLLYFDSRESQHQFLARDVELVSRLGEYVLEIERREA